MIKGIGIDLVSTKRIKKIASIDFLNRIYSIEELKIYHSITNEALKLDFLAGRFAAKEALFKAYSSGDKTANYRDFSILNLDSGKPYVISKHIQKNEIIHISITHTDGYALAQVIIEI